MKIAKLFALMIILSISVTVSGQESEVEESSDNLVPENVMREIVRRILIYKFKPVKRKKVIYLAQNGIERSWLPEIGNIEFRLISNGEVEDRDSGVYFFTKPQLTKNTYEINFAFGNPNCEYLGDGWNFRIANNKVRLWYAGEIGGGCSAPSFGALIKLEELNTYPNELKGYEFFDKGKLKGLKLTISTKEDVQNNFGADCERSCDYDENWTAYFSYFGDFYRERTENDVKTKIISKPEYLGKLYSITLRPKKTVLFDKVVFPSKFHISYGHTAAHDGKGGGTNTSYHSFTDRYGLEYSILEEISLTTIKDLKWQKGELMSIEYTIPEKLEKEMFVEEN